MSEEKAENDLKDENENKFEENKSSENKDTKNEKIKNIINKEITINIGFLYKFIKKYYVPILLISIFLLSFYVRVVGFRYNYLRNIDSYWHYRYMKMIIENNGKLPEYDTLMEAPEFRKIDTMHLYHYLGAYSYLLVKIFNSNLELWRFLIYFPAFLASLAVIPCYFIGKRLFDKKVGIFLAFLVVFNPAIMSRSLGGDPDSDAIVLLIPLISLALFFEAYNFSKIGNIKKSIIFSILTGISMAALAYTWVSWHLFYFVTGFCLLAILSEIKNKEFLKFSKRIITSYFIIILIFFGLTIPIIGSEFIYITLNGPFESFQLKSEDRDFPNVYVSVAEMMTGGTIKNVGNSLGIYLIRENSRNIFEIILTFLFFGILIYSFAYLFFEYFKKRKHLECLIYVALWGGGFLIASLYAIRFSIFLVTPLSLLFSIFLSKIWDFVKIDLSEKE